MAQARQYWLMKTEPESFSIHDLAKSPRKTTFWDGVRNYQARNFMRAMKTGDEVLFYPLQRRPSGRRWHGHGRGRSVSRLHGLGPGQPSLRSPGFAD